MALKRSFYLDYRLPPRRLYFPELNQERDLIGSVDFRMNRSWLFLVIRLISVCYLGDTVTSH